MKMNYPLMIPFPAQNCQVYRIFTFIFRVVAQLKRIFTVITSVILKVTSVVNVARRIGHFRVPKTLTLKTRPIAKPFL